ncbi:MAG: phenylacetate--CoA ligase family protein, partial [Paludibacteraceae bacterium]|nr:phenylacetate--CoA ligase family protein [Paludibacteraceae bacterium]
MYNPDIEFASTAEIKAYQEARLREHLAYLKANSPFYQRLFRDSRINIADVKTLEDLQRIPFTD